MKQLKKNKNIGKERYIWGITSGCVGGEMCATGRRRRRSFGL